MPSFDLTTEPWIPVQPLGSEPVCKVSLRTALAEAHAFREVYADSPLETTALYRLLQALALRLFLEPKGAQIANEDEARWWDLFDAGRFNADAVHKYFDEWQGEKQRFDLLHPERPFYQHLEPMTSKETPVAKLFAGRSSGNNAVLFDHATDGAPRPVSLAAAARALVATQATTLGGGRSEPFYYSDAPLVAGAVFWVRGESLFEALLLNTPPDDRARMKPGSAPSWERGKLPEPSPRIEEGYLDYLTWPSRRVLLRTEEGEDGVPVAVAMQISQGDKREAEGEDDPLMAFRHSDKAGRYPFKLRKGQALWRDADLLMQTFTPETGGAPRAVHWVAGQFEKHVWWVDAFGLVNDQAKIERWQHSRLPLYPAILKDGEKQHDLKMALARAGGGEVDGTKIRGQSEILQYAARLCAGRLLSPDEGYGGLGKQGRADARNLADALGAETRFWARLEDAFLAWLEELADTDAPKIALARWTKALYKTAKSAYADATDSLGESARHLRARAEGRARLKPAAAYAEALAA